MAPIPTPIYHITSVENLPAIFQVGRLLAKNAIDQEDFDYTNIAYHNIQDRRSDTPVPCGPGGNLHDYVPFYFGPKSPMLYTISRGNVRSFSGGQSSIVYFVSTAQRVAEEGLGFVFTDGHGIVRYTDFFDELNDLDEVDWNLMNATMWSDTEDDNDRKRRRQAEFLVHNQFDCSLIDEITVFNRSMQSRVEEVLVASGYNDRIELSVRQNWYY